MMDETTDVRVALRNALLDPAVRYAAQEALLKEAWRRPARPANEYDVSGILEAIWNAADLQAGPFVLDAELDEMDELTQSAVPGPWRTVQLDGFGAEWFLVTDAPKQYPRVIAAFLLAGNIYHMKWMERVREFVPRAIAEIRRLRSLLAEHATP